ncbi:hypothetical protein QQS21_012836 [Conoideocrella luteorostrata]|uniref:Dihydrofolate reductase n=1 Tax=Conoideocrella luteorostrata TaxID=1105319 RepID=A0AAJ0CBK7_9HYPO|nr:hypothetical protein QQS21_012836 [Conoideocrella luteorostrata]
MHPELTLIVAATRTMGIGLNGSMPWSGLRKEMQYFARVTSRVPPQSPANSINAVIMGRKTWDSIPPKFRPLKNRINIVISRSSRSSPDAALPSSGSSEPVCVASLDQAVSYVRDHPLISRVFVMGGGQIYSEALRREDAKRVLLTSIEKEYECDTFFGADLESEKGWRRLSVGDWRDWTGEDGEGLVMEEAGVRYEWQMWER